MKRSKWMIKLASGTGTNWIYDTIWILVYTTSAQALKKKKKAPNVSLHILMLLTQANFSFLLSSLFILICTFSCHDFTLCTSIHTSLPSVWSCPAGCSWCRIPPADSCARWSQNPQTPPCWDLWSPAEGERREDEFILDSLMVGFTGLYFWHVFRKERFL